jgi:hypothetical protein
MQLATDLSAEHAQLLAGLVRERERARLATRPFAERVAEITNGRETWSASRVTRIEGGRTRPTRADVETWLDVTCADSETRSTLLELADTVAVEAKPWSRVWQSAGGAPVRQGTYEQWERDAKRIVVFQPVDVPGLAQTAEYARQVITLFGVPERDIPAMVQARMQRTSVLYEPDREVVLLITEAAVRLRIVPVQALVEQVDRLITINTLANVRLGIVPLNARVTVAPLSAFVIFELPAHTIVTVELLTDEVEIVDPVQVARYQRAVEQWETSAVFGAEAADLLGQIRRDLTATD